MIEKSTIQFLKDLKENNDRDWFKANKSRFEDAKENMIEVTDAIIGGISEFHPEVATQEGKKCLFRIYRDVRFSKDKSPYKTNLAATITSEGRKAHIPGYYIHIQPGDQSVIGGGAWAPAGPAIAAIRQEIDYNLDEFKELIENNKAEKYFGGLSDMGGDKLKKPPKGYTKENPAIEILKNKHFILSHQLTDEDVLSKGFVRHAVDVFKYIKPFDDFLLRAMEDVEKK